MNSWTFCQRSQNCRNVSLLVLERSLGSEVRDAEARQSNQEAAETKGGGRERENAKQKRDVGETVAVSPKPVTQGAEFE